MKICFMCKKECRKEKYPTYVIKCKNNILICLECNKNYLNFFEKIKYSHFRYIRYREISNKI